MEATIGLGLGLGLGGYLLKGDYTLWDPGVLGLFAVRYAHSNKNGHYHIYWGLGWLVGNAGRGRL